MMQPRLLFETESLLVLDKPAGLIVHSDGRTNEESVAVWLLSRDPTLAQVGEPWVSPQGETILTAGLVHRLDRATSGTLVVAKTHEMYAYLKQQFKERRVEKRYLGIVYGHTSTSSGHVVAEIVRSSVPPKKWYARPTILSDKRAAITKWRLIEHLRNEHGNTASYLELEPKTGRTHQIRVHLASIGHPLIADHLYAPQEKPLFGLERPALHASGIAFTLPNGRRCCFDAPLPQDLTRALG